MRLRTFYWTWLLAGVALSSKADDSMTGWIADRVHPQLEYRFKCVRGGLTIEWRNSYPGAVTLTARIRGSSYDGDENVVIPPSGAAKSNPETMYCTAELFEIPKSASPWRLHPRHLGPLRQPGNRTGSSRTSRLLHRPPSPPGCLPLRFRNCRWKPWLRSRSE